METTRPAPLVLLIDDHALFRTGLRLLLADHWPEAVLQEAGSLDALLSAPPARVPDLIVLDLQLPGMDGMTGLKAIRATLGAVPVVMVSSQSDPTMLRRAREQGAAGFIAKSAPALALADGLRRAWEGAAVWLGQDDVGESGAAGASRPEPGDGPWVPSLLQRRMLSLLASHRSNKALSHALSMTEHQVRAEMSTVMERLGVVSRDAAYRVAAQQGWLNSEAAS
jgi:two-component system nitrate/nitrite response regulator NarL